MRTNSQFFVKRNKKRYYEIGGVFIPYLKRKDRARIEIELAYERFGRFMSDNFYNLEK